MVIMPWHGKTPGDPRTGFAHHLLSQCFNKEACSEEDLIEEFNSYFEVVTDFPSTWMIRGKYQNLWRASLFLVGTQHCPILAPGAVSANAVKY